MLQVSIDITMAEDLEGLEALLQALRHWDGGRADRHMTIACHSPSLTATELAGIYARLQPPLPSLRGYPRKDGA